MESENKNDGRICRVFHLDSMEVDWRCIGEAFNLSL